LDIVQVHGVNVYVDDAGQYGFARCVDDPTSALGWEIGLDGSYLFSQDAHVRFDNADSRDDETISQ
jgi:hypothetical protein